VSRSRLFMQSDQIGMNLLALAHEGLHKRRADLPTEEAASL